jgi:CRISPR-associated exonuclease Cas4
MSRMITSCDFRVTDLKQFAYCARIPFYQHVMDLRIKETYKMEQGKTAQAAIEALEKRRKLREYGLSEGRRHFGLWLFSERFNLSGKLDLLVETDSACYPVDFKYTTGRPHRNHLFQLAGYALLVSERLGKPVPAGFIYQMTDDAVFRFEMSEPLLSEARAALSSLQSMIEKEIFPPATPVRARCTDCEYRNFCGDVF